MDFLSWVYTSLLDQGEAAADPHGSSQRKQKLLRRGEEKGDNRVIKQLIYTTPSNQSNSGDLVRNH